MISWSSSGSSHNNRSTDGAALRRKIHVSVRNSITSLVIFVVPQRLSFLFATFVKAHLITTVGRFDTTKYHSSGRQSRLKIAVIPLKSLFFCGVFIFSHLPHHLPFKQMANGSSLDRGAMVPSRTDYLESGIPTYSVQQPELRFTLTWELFAQLQMIYI